MKEICDSVSASRIHVFQRRFLLRGRSLSSWWNQKSVGRLTRQIDLGGNVNVSAGANVKQLLEIPPRGTSHPGSRYVGGKIDQNGPLLDSVFQSYLCKEEIRRIVACLHLPLKGHFVG